MEEMMTKVMKSVTDSMQSSDQMFVELEEKRMKFEAEQRKEEREFQFKMAQMLDASQVAIVVVLTIVIAHTLHLLQESFIIVWTTVKLELKRTTQLWMFTYYDCNNADKLQIL